MKIMIFNTLYYPHQIGGAEKSVQLLAEGLLQVGHDPIVVCTSNEEKVDYVNGIKVYYLSPKNLYWSIKNANKSKIQKMVWHGIDICNPLMLKSINKIIDQEKPDIIHTNNLTGLSTAPWICAKKKKIPVVHTLRDYSLMCPKSTMFKKGSNCKTRCLECKLYSEGKRWLTNKGWIHYLIGNSQFMINHHKANKFFVNTPGKRIFNGAIIENKSNNINKTLSDRRMIKFLYMGRIEETKGVNLLLDVFSKIQNAELMLAGKVYDNTISQNLSLGRYPSNIRFLGFTKPEEILPQIDVLIAPSLWNEPLPRVILEAYAYGKPVVGSNRGGVPESIDHGKTGLIFDPEKKDDLKEKIEMFIRNPEIIQYMSNNIPDYLKKFDIKISVKQYIDIYNLLLKK
jgi:glycosyltransferase involved in cell wall biosynthesis